MEYTEDEIKTMAPGRAMDLLIAKHVLGHEVIESDRTFTRAINKERPGYWGPLAKYSTDTTEAWALVEAHKGAVAVVKADNCYEAKFYALDDEDAFFTPVSADTAALAICRAALLALLNQS